MNCEGARESMILALYEELPPLAGAGLEQHVAGCRECSDERELLLAAIAALETHPLVEPDPNLLAESRMRLDAALDALPRSQFLAGLRINALSWVGHVRGAPALATLLLGVGFLGGNFSYRYQVAHEPRMQPAVTLTNTTGGGVSSISGIAQLPGDRVQVSYNRVVPEMVQGSLDDPQIRQLLMVGTRATAENGVRADSVRMLADECSIGHECQVDALLATLRADHDPRMRVRALEGLSRYVSQDERVRDAMARTLLLDPNAAVRTKAIALLEPVQGDTSVRQALRTVSTRDENPYIRTASTQALIGSSSIQ